VATGTRTSGRRAGPLAAAIAACLWTTASTHVAAAETTASTLKAAFLYNFAKFTEWPADALAPGQRLSLCVMGDASVADALEQTIQGRQLEGHELSVRVVKSSDPLRSCHLLYADRADGHMSTQVLQAVGGAAVLTVSDSDRFVEAGGIAQLILEGDRMRFAVNVDSARRSRLTLSSKLLNLARIVKDGQGVAR
jgi:uncharacterized protein DUF4154